MTEYVKTLKTGGQSAADVYASIDSFVKVYTVAQRLDSSRSSTMLD
jgi:hypothetical protein